MSGDGAGHKLWGGRFAGGPAPELEAVNRSITVDYRLWPFDIRLSQAWARGLQTAGVYTAEECARVVAGLDAVAKRFAAGEQPIAADEDIHTMVDRLLHEEAGAPAGRLHTGRSRNDQVATDTRLWTLDAIARLDVMLRDVQLALLSKFTTADEMSRFLATPEGRRLEDQLASPKGFDARKQVIDYLTGGVVVLFIGVAMTALARVGMAFMAIPGFICLGVGIACLIAAAFIYPVAKRLGLIAAPAAPRA